MTEDAACGTQSVASKSSNVRTTACLSAMNPASPSAGVQFKTTISKEPGFRLMVFEAVSKVHVGQETPAIDVVANCDEVISWILMTGKYDEILQDPPVCAGEGVKVKEQNG